MTSRSRAGLLAFAVLGLAAASYSSYVHYQMLARSGYTSLCDISATVSCTDVYESQYGSLFGVPVALFGVLFFVVVLVLVGVAGRASSPARDSVPGYVFVLSTLALAFALYLAYASYFVLHKFCIFCAINYVAVIGLFIVSGGAAKYPMTTVPKRASRDLRSLVSSPLALIIALVVVGGGIAAVALFPKATPANGGAAEAQVSIPPIAAEERARLEQWWDLQPKVDLPIAPSPGAKVQIVKFSDYQCPGCRSAHNVFRQVLPRYDKAVVEFVMKHYPLEGECNPNVPGGNHYASCEAAAAYVMARGTGFQQQLDDWLFANQQTLTRETVKEALKDQAGIQDFDARYERALQEVKTDASLGGLIKVGSTPTVYLNGRMISGRTPQGQSMNMPGPQYLDALIDIELKRAK
jgi:uncharacterized membrane protein/protein-disulfide isomerase